MTSHRRLNATDKDLFLGIDVGGTEVKVGLVDAGGNIVARERASTPALRTPERVFEYAIEFAHAKVVGSGLAQGRVLAVGLAVPGVLDAHEFRLREVVNLPGWLEVPLLERLRSIAERPTVVVNDANAAAFAEYSRRGLDDQSLALVTLGTGIGCGVVVRGRPYGGDHGCAGELGHIAIDFGPEALPCTCGSRGHLESYAGAAGVMNRLQRAIASRQAKFPSGLQADDLTPREVAKLAEDGDSTCRAIIAETGCYVGRAIGMLGQTLDPAVVLIGGAMTFGGAHTAMGACFLDHVRRSVQETTLVQVGGNIAVEFAELGNDAGVLGAALVAKQACRT